MAMARKSLTNVNFCELFSCELFGTFIGSIYICIGLVRFISKAFLRFTNEAMMKKVYLIVSFMFLVNIGVILPSGAQTILLDKESSRPIVRASVFDEENHPVGLTDSNGFLPDLKGAKGIRITCLGYQTMETKVSDIGKELYLVPMDYPLKEVVVNSDSQYSRLKLTCYYRDFVVFGGRIYTDMLGGNTDLFYSDGICTIYIPRPGILSVITVGAEHGGYRKEQRDVRYYRGGECDNRVPEEERLSCLGGNHSAR